MLKTIETAFRVKSLRKKLAFTALMIALVRLGSQVPVPGLNLEYFREWFAQNSNGMLNMFSAFTGGSFERFSLFALGVTPYITATIVIQLLTVAIPSLEQLSRDGDYGRKKIEKISRWTAVGLAAAESAAMAVGFGRAGLFPGMTALRGVFAAACLTGGAALVMAIGWAIDKKGIGNGISIVLLVNVLAGTPQDFAALFEMHVKGKTPAKGALAAAVVIGVAAATVALVVMLNEAYRKIPIRYSAKSGKGTGYATQNSFLPIKVNLTSVLPVIFASSIFSIPQMIAAMLGKSGGFFLSCLNQNAWFDPNAPWHTLGLVLYLALIFFFAFFYANITFNPIEVADTLKKQGGSIPGIRQGKPTEEYLRKTVDRIVVIGAAGLVVVVLVPTFFGSLAHANLSFGGTSVIIVVGVVLETLDQIESETRPHTYQRFLKG